MECVEDDVLFADLTERISLLIMDDDDDDDDDDPILQGPPLSFQVISQTIRPVHNQIPRNFQEQNGRREIKGTGVFIPQSITNRRKSCKQSRSKSSNTKLVQTQRLFVDTSSGPFPREPYTNQDDTTNTSFISSNHKRRY